MATWIDGLILAALATGGTDASNVPNALEPHIAAFVAKRLDTIARAPDREHALASQVRVAAPAALTALPSSLRAASLLQAATTREVRAQRAPLPMPRRRFRPAPGLRRFLRAWSERTNRPVAEREITALESRPWPE